MAQGRFVDGRSPQVREAAVEAWTEGLHIRHDGGDAVWAWADIIRRDGAPGEARLSWRGDDAQRLTLSASDWRALKPAGARSSEGRVRFASEAKIGAGLVLLAVAIFGVIFLAAPVMGDAVGRWAPPSWEARMGAAAEAQVSGLFPPCRGPGVAAGDAALTRLAERLGAHADARFPITVTLVKAPMPNAFALPGGRVMVNSALIEEAGDPDEAAGVLAHEVAHVAERHVVKGYARAMTIGALADLVIGGGGTAAPVAAGVVNVTALRYSRADEAEADARGMDYLQASGLDPSALARFFDRVLKIESDRKFAGGRLPEFFSDHPDTRRRAEASRARTRPGTAPAMDAAEWAAVKAACATALQ